MNRRNFLFTLLAAPVAAVSVFRHNVAGPTTSLAMLDFMQIEPNKRIGKWMHSGSMDHEHITIHADGRRTVRSMTFEEVKSVMSDLESGKFKGCYFKETAGFIKETA